MKFLKQSTSTVIAFGPGLLPSDGVTLVTTLVSALDNATTGIMLCKNGAAAAVRHATVTATSYDAYGSYLVTLDATDTGTVGRLRVMFAAAASCLPIWEDFTVLSANVYDSFVAGSANLQVDTTKVGGTTQTARDLGLSVLLSTGTGTGQLDFTSGVVKANATQLLGTAWLTPAVAGTPDVNAKQLGGTAQTGRDVGTSVLLSPGTGTGQLDFTSGVVKSNLAQILGTALTETAGLLAGGFKKLFNVASPTLTCLGIDQTGDNFPRLGAPVNASHSADVAAVKVDTAAIKLKTDNLPAAPAAVGDIVSAAAVASAVGSRTPTESYAADGVAPTYDQFLYMLWACMAQFAITSTTISAKKLNGSDEAMTFTLNDATTPTSRTRTT